MADFNLVMPKLGESVQEATITRWLVKPGDVIEEDAVLLEIATDKVDSEIPSPVAGKVLKILFAENALVPVGEVIAVINTEGQGEVSENQEKPQAKESKPVAAETTQAKSTAGAGELKTASNQPADGAITDEPSTGTQGGNFDEEAGESDRFYSPLVMSIARKEKISGAELDSIKGTGENGRVRKQDILKYLEQRSNQPAQAKQDTTAKAVPADRPAPAKVNVSAMAGDEIVQMDRMRKMIADHMVMSKQVSPHVTNFVEADVTNLALWREKVKDSFAKREKIKLTFMPAFLEATAKALREYPGVNASVDGDKIILRKNINIGFAVALKNGNLIVPVLKNADQKSMVGLAVELNRLSEAARNSSLSPDDIQGGTFTISNFGTFRNITGTPIINQPQVAILATGNIEKKPAVIETPTGDVIAIRHKMILSLSYDHRVVDGALGGMFLRRIADILEQFDINREV
ncbi:MAG TPA: dihydrolipoamide acetyltransferase family protein [Bacteroidales bacterium]|nr:dihydrolipoamide acetyltransferase family protein [Bacteroidales bacterium]